MKRAANLKESQKNSMITLCLAARLHEGNPWLLERIALIAEYYEPLPPIILVDFGSEGQYQENLETLCLEKGIDYLYIADYGLFSLSTARNRAVERATTNFVCLCDPDFFMTRDFFGKVSGIIQRQGWENQIDLMFNLPAAHFKEDPSHAFFAEKDHETQSTILERNYIKAIYNTQEEALFLTPYTNVHVCHRSGYILCGGYNENFRGYGSDDYEFLLRYCMTMRYFPLPKKPGEDMWGSKSDGFYLSRDYVGFRRMFEALSFLAEAYGLFAGHMHHPINKDDPWVVHMDRKKVNFKREVQKFLDRPARLLWYDWIKHPKTILLLIRQRNHYTLFAPLRLAGYRLIPLFNDTPDLEKTFHEALKREKPSFVILFNPYMQSHKPLKVIFDKAVASGLQPFVVERGALPDSWYFASEVSYGDPDFHPFDFLKTATLSAEEINKTIQYRHNLVKGNQTLEENGSYDVTKDKYLNCQDLKCFKVKCFIPLQLPEDMAVNYFCEGYQSYQDFVAEIRTCISEFPNVLFVIKRHPQDLLPLEFSDIPNCHLCAPDDNVHALIELADVVISYNSGVGLLTLIHGKPLFTVGNAFYNQEGFGRRVNTFKSAAQLTASGELPQIDDSSFTAFLAWLLFYKYSFFTSTSQNNPTKKGDRTIRIYDDFRVQSLNINDSSLRYTHFYHQAPFAKRSYLAGRLGLFAPKKSKVPQGWFAKKRSAVFKFFKKFFA